MKVIAPVSVSASMLTSSTLPETEYSAWSSGGTYALAARAIKGHKVWESVAGSNLNHDPETDDGSWWLEVGPTNRWAMFDGSVSTASTDSNDIEVQITPGVIVDSVGIISGVGSNVRVQMHNGATSVYDQTQSLDSTPIEDWEMYFTADQVLAGELIFQNVPKYLSGVITVTITKASGIASIGALVIGRIHDLGRTLTNASAGITDYSRKETDDFGTVYLVQRTYAKTCQVRMRLDTDELRRVQSVLSGLRATPAVWIGAADTDRFAPIVIFGWYRSFSMDLQDMYHSYCTLEIEGLT